MSKVIKKSPQAASRKVVDNSSQLVEFELHLGKEIREIFASSSKRQVRMAEQLRISSQAFQGKLNNPVFGTIYDLIKTSIFLDIDFLDYIRQHLAKLGYKTFIGENEIMRNELVEAKKRINLLQSENEILDNLCKVRSKLG